MYSRYSQFTPMLLRRAVRADSRGRARLSTADLSKWAVRDLKTELSKLGIDHSGAGACADVPNLRALQHSIAIDSVSLITAACFEKTDLITLATKHGVGKSSAVATFSDTVLALHHRRLRKNVRSSVV